MAVHDERNTHVKMGDNYLGLMERDLPGGSEAIEEVGEHLEALLTRKGKGLTVEELWSETERLCRKHLSLQPVPWRLSVGQVI